MDEIWLNEIAKGRALSNPHRRFEDPEPTEIAFGIAEAEQPTAAPTHLRIANAIKHVESQGNYKAKGGSGEYGAYQIMPETWNEWSSKINPNNEPLPMTPENQDKVAQAIIKEWVDNGYTPEEVAATWNSGKPKGWRNKAGTNKYGIKYNVPAYVGKVMKKYSEAK